MIVSEALDSARHSVVQSACAARVPLRAQRLHAVGNASAEAELSLKSRRTPPLAPIGGHDVRQPDQLLACAFDSSASG
jgi:hypothetical protein